MQLVVGRIGRPHGIRGEVTVEVRTDDPDRRFGIGVAIGTDPAERGPLTVESVRPHQGALLVGFAGVDDRDAAEDLRGTLLVIDSADLDDIDDPDEFYDHQLEGLRVDTVGGDELGVVEAVQHGGQDLLVVRLRAGKHGLIPFVKEIVPVVDLEGGRMVVDPPPGLLD